MSADKNIEQNDRKSIFFGRISKFHSWCRSFNRIIHYLSPIFDTGLDPAGPFFNLMGNPLSNSDAEFVDIVHTDMGVYGIIRITGTVDFFPNSGRRIQPGCPTKFALYSEEGTQFFFYQIICHLFDQIFSIRTFHSFCSKKVFLFVFFFFNCLFCFQLSFQRILFSFYTRRNDYDRLFLKQCDLPSNGIFSANNLKVFPCYSLWDKNLDFFAIGFSCRKETRSTAQILIGAFH